MKLYFSGVASQREADMLREASVDHVLADPRDMGNALEVGASCVVLDSGAYRLWKKDERHEPPFLYLADVKLNQYEYVVAPDVLGDAVASIENYDAAQALYPELPLMPVYQIMGSVHYLDECLARAKIVGIGGLVPLMRDHNRIALRRILYLVEDHPGRLHLFGVNWLAALDMLKPTDCSVDTSKWLDGARYGTVFVDDQAHGRLGEMRLGGLDRRKRCVLNAKTLRTYFND